MKRCPVCQSVRIVIVLSAVRRAFCTRCGTQWTQEGAEQKAVRRLARVSVRSSLSPRSP
jgi:uncharacterized paraquat-inducible protein A